jgi:hypothetical protein
MIQTLKGEKNQKLKGQKMVQKLIPKLTIKKWLNSWKAKEQLIQKLKGDNKIVSKVEWSTRRRMARERRGAGSSLVSMETQFYKQYMKDVL